VSAAESGTTCPQCGRPMPAAAVECPACGSPRVPFAASRQAVVLFSLALLVALFLFTGFITRVFLRHESDLGQEWFDRGEAELAAGRPAEAQEALRTALVYSKDNRAYELKLVEALAAAGRDDEARAYLRGLRDAQPAYSPVNLELARLEARRGNSAEAIRDYQAAIYGVWDANGEQRRRQTRLELIEYLTSLNRRSEALAEILSFAANLPPDPALHLRVAQLLFDQKNYQQALAEFQETLRLRPHDPQALAGIGQTLFATGKYSQAQGSLEQAHRADPKDAAVERLLEVSRDVVSMDPYASGLSAKARVLRLQHDFELATNRLAFCVSVAPAPQNALLAGLEHQAASLQPKLKQRDLLRDMDLFDSAAALALDAEARAAALCGPGSNEDQALVLLAQQRPGAAR